MSFNSQTVVDDLDERNSSHLWQGGRSDIYPETTRMESQQDPNQLLLPTFSENGNQLNWQDFQDFTPQNDYANLGLGFQAQFNSPNSNLMQSPSIVQDRRSSAGFSSDHGYPDLSAHPSPAYLDDQLEEQFGPKLVLGDDGSISNVDVPPRTSATTQSHWNSSNYDAYPGNNQLLSPNLTGTSSPGSGIGEPAFTTAVPISRSLSKVTNGATTLTSTATVMPTHSFGSPQEYTNPSDQPTFQFQADGVQVMNQHHIGSYGEDLSENHYPNVSSGQATATNVSQMQTGRASSSISGEHTNHKRSLTASEPEQGTADYPVDRLDDGSWRANEATGHSGLAPEYRSKLSNAVIPTIEEQEQQRELDGRNADVEEWLSRSQIESSSKDAASQLAIPVKENASRRRAKSTGAPFIASYRTYLDDSHIPGPGINVQEQSDLDEDADGSSYDAEGDESPPARVDDSLLEQRSALSSPHPDQESSHPDNAKPWNDEPNDAPNSSIRYQPVTSNAAMMKYYMRAKNVETASRSATIGSRRRSDTDAESLFSFTAGAAQLAGEKSAAKSKAESEKPGSLFTSFKSRRPSGNLLKRKNTSSAMPGQHQAQSNSQQQTNDAKPHTPMISVSIRRPRIDTRLKGDRSPREPSSAVSPNALSPWNQAKQMLRRSRSVNSREPEGLSHLIAQHGGPPMPKLASLGSNLESLQTSDLQDQDDDDADMVQEPESNGASSVTMNMEVRYERIVPSVEGFKDHVLRLNPRLDAGLADRIASEQLRRYRKLLDARRDHAKDVRSGACPSGDRCVGLGGTFKLLPLRTSNKSTATTTAGFQILSSPVSEEDADKASQSDGLIVPAQFPSGIPIPPTTRLPAEFECPLCFKVKQFIKPSDWTKHVHEDVSPFTCTFEGCTETKSFKRKADWVRHENERHRRLESWNCNVPDCTHSCHRKDNFVQHLVREHGLPEPKVRTGKSMSGAAATGPVNIKGTRYKDIWELIEECKQDTSKVAEGEACRFCGNTCNSWKKLTVHLAKHLEQISLPVLGLLEQSSKGPDKGPTPKPPTVQNFDLPQQIDYRQAPASLPVQNSMPPRVSPVHEQIPLRVDTKPQIGLTTAAPFVSSSTSAQTYPPVQFPNQAVDGSQGFLQGQSPVYPPYGFSATANQHFSSAQPFLAKYSGQPLSSQSGVFPIGGIASTAHGQQSFVSSPVDADDFGSGVFSGHHIHSSTYPGR
ncbi:MAG: hypothetical protein M1822_000207 [Bathelium mastoideum]|nr:MAG: hypothetical protein M1822_000207 [Bathelium mastoideum]